MSWTHTKACSGTPINTPQDVSVNLTEPAAQPMFGGYKESIKRFQSIRTGSPHEIRLTDLHTTYTLDHLDIVWFPNLNTHLVGYRTRLGSSNAHPTFSIVGTLKTKHLPPVRGPAVHETPIEARQNVCLTGYDPTAESALARLLTHIQDRSPRVVSMRSPFGAWCNVPTFDVGNPYFTENNQLENIPFTMTEDPEGVLADLKPANAVRSQINVVEYMASNHTNESGPKYSSCSPFKFQYGDTVEISFVFVLTEGRDHMLLLTPTLKKVTLLERRADMPSSSRKNSKRPAENDGDIREFFEVEGASTSTPKRKVQRHR